MGRAIDSDARTGSLALVFDNNLMNLFVLSAPINLKVSREVKGALDRGSDTAVSPE
jgi:hypothetical protein